MVDDLNPADLGLTGRKVLVTGAAQGIGRACAVWLAQLGARVVLADIQDCTSAVAQAGHGATARHLDLTDRVAGEALIEDLTANGEALYALVNCAGLLVRQPLESITPEQIELHTAVNQTGVFYLARAAMAAMRRQGEGGRIVLYTSQGAFTGGAFGSTHYAMNKAALTALMKSMARLGGPDGITVNAVSPGAVDTPMFRGGMSEADIAQFCKTIPVGRPAEPQELAAPTAFLLSEWARYITGTTLHVNGGQLMV
jgi:NAD(P)-dependent dehydrogenase (short-subunit alcohol dehydrogenase family)